GATFDPEPFHGRFEVLRPMTLDIHFVEDEQPLLAHPLRERGLQGVLLLPHRDALRIGARDRTMRGAAVTMNGRAASPLPRPAGPLLLEGLLPRTGDLGPDLRLVRSATQSRQMRLDDLPDQMASEGIVEDVLGQPDLADPLLLPIDDRQCAHELFLVCLF